MFNLKNQQVMEHNGFSKAIAVELLEMVIGVLEEEMAKEPVGDTPVDWKDGFDHGRACGIAYAVGSIESVKAVIKAY